VYLKLLKENKYIFIGLPTYFETNSNLRDFDTKIKNFNPEQIVTSYITDENSNPIKFKVSSAILFNRLEKHYTIIKRKNNLNDWILIDSIFYNTTNNINFPIDLKKIYILLLERL
jgi:hypothetical protein